MMAPSSLSPSRTSASPKKVRGGLCARRSPSRGGVEIKYRRDGVSLVDCHRSAADNVTAVVVEFPWVDAAKVDEVRARARSAIAEAKKQQADEPLDMFA